MVRSRREAAAQTEEVKFGLQLNTTKKNISDTKPKEANLEPEKPQVQLTEDQVAIEALLGNNPNGNANTTIIAPEDAAFQTDYASAPDVATLDEYLSVPVEEFGAALLRGMGWREGETPGRRRHQQHQQQPGHNKAKANQPNVPKERRAALLGIGAKEEAAMGVELGAWGPGRQAKDATKKLKSRKLVDQVYNPVLLRNKVTGEQLTEEELKLRLDQQKMEFLRQKGEGKEGETKDDDRHSRRKGEDRDRKNDRYRGREIDRDNHMDRNRDWEQSRFKDSYRERWRESEKTRRRDIDEGRDKDRDRDRRRRDNNEKNYPRDKIGKDYDRNSHSNGKYNHDRYREKKKRSDPERARDGHGGRSRDRNRYPT